MSFNKYIYLSGFTSLSAADAAALSAGLDLVIDSDIALTSAVTIGSVAVFAGGVITRAAHCLSFSNAIVADPTIQCFDDSGSGLVTLANSEIFDNWFGCKNGTDSTAAMDAAMACADVSGAKLFWTNNALTYSGVGHAFANGRVAMAGVSKYGTNIILDALVYFIDCTAQVYFVDISDISFSGGKGAYRSRYKGTNSSVATRIFRRVRFTDYRECASQDNDIDGPFYRYLDCDFQGYDSINTIGVAFGALPDESSVTGSIFSKNRIHIKARSGGSGARFKDASCYQSDAGDGDFPRAAVWLTQGTTENNDNGRLEIGLRMSGEGQVETDYYIIIADEQAPSGGHHCNGDLMPDLSSPSTMTVNGLKVGNCSIGAVYKRPLVYSMTPNLRHIDISGNRFDAQMSCLLKYGSPLANDRELAMGIFGPNSYGGEMGVDLPPFPISLNGYVPSLTPDPTGQLECDPKNFHCALGTTNDFGDYVELFNSRATSFSLNGDATLVGSAIDPQGGADANQFSMSSAGSISATLNYANISPAAPAFVEFWLKGGATPPVQVFAQLLDNSTPAVIAWMRYPLVSGGWAQYVFPHKFQAGGQMKLLLSVPDATAKQFYLGIVRVYEARGPKTFGRLRVEALDFSLLPRATTAPAGLVTGDGWIDTGNGNVLKII